MTEKTNLREQFNALADRVQAALPDRLLIDLVFSVNQDKKTIRIDKTPEADFNGVDIKQVTDIVKQTFRGDYISAPGGSFYWSVPLFQDVPIPPHAVANQKAEETPAAANTPAACKVEPEKVVGPNPEPPIKLPPIAQAQPAPQPQPEPAAEEKSAAKNKTLPTERSPVSQFMDKFCGGCEDRFNGCNPRTEEGKRKMDVCFQVLSIDMQRNLDLDVQALKRAVEKSAASQLEIVETFQKTVSALIQGLAKTEPPKQTPQTGKPAAAPAPAPASTPAPKKIGRSVDDVRLSLPEDLRDRVEYKDEGVKITMKPKGFLGADNYGKIAKVVRASGGDTVITKEGSTFWVPTGRDAQPSAPAPAAAPRKETHVEDGIVWTNESGGNGPYEKASEENNRGQSAFYQLEDWIREAGDKPYKDGFYYWIFNQGPLALGRKKCRQTGSR